VLAACGSDTGSSSPATGSPTSAPSAGNPTANTTGDTAAVATVPPATGTSETTIVDECVSEIPDETGGPYPGDGTNGVNVLTEDGIVRSDITSSFGSSTTTTEGIPMELVLTIQDAATCTPVAGAAVYVWHCTAAGEYSLYSNTVIDENFLRGVQESDANGQVRFSTIVPGCYDGRWPHMHFEIFDALSDAISGNNSIKTTQLAIPAQISEAVYTDARYPRSADNLARVSLTSDMVFADDGGAQQVASMSGDNDAGYRGQLTVGI
jgi:protocatechuate 3,4-dioxygenase beta subunit